MPITTWHDGGQLPFIQPLTGGWSYRNAQDPQFPWREAPGDTWAAQQPNNVFEFGWRNSYTQLRTSLPNQTVSILTTCPKLRILGEVNGAFSPEVDWNIFLNGQVLELGAYSFNTSAAFVETSAPQNSGVFNVTIQLKSTFSGTMGIKGLVCTTMTERPSEPSLPMLFGQTGNRLLFVNNSAPQPQFQITGSATAENYTLKNGEGVPALVLRGDTVLKYKLPPALTHVQLRGFVGPNYGRARISFDPPAPVDLLPNLTDFSTNRSWFAVSSFFSVPLNANTQYTLSVSTDAATAGDGVYLDVITVLLRVDEDGPFGPAMSFEQESEILSDRADPEPRKVTNIGAIVGGVVGGVCALIIGALVLYFLRRRRPQPVTPSTGGYFEVDETQDLTPTIATPTNSSSPSSPIDSTKSNLAACIHNLPPGAGPPREPVWRGSYATLQHGSYATLPAHRPESLGIENGHPASPGGSPDISPTRTSPETSTKAPRRPRRMGQRPVVQEDDGGTLLPEFVPPRYNPEWALQRESQQERREQ
ncbi:hypothetical protein CcaverHIS631_0102130 [Cutaneotrichosporon cavernicola]|nr:hypothetical protein CcaverHIS631_0102130 [Cutaneotrichosporon cavernicola]BEJ03037.1 hypothetical protein CcaverHIS641_0102120 [Cutaneotrichosporon cavernicola]